MKSKKSKFLILTLVCLGFYSQAQYSLGLKVGSSFSDIRLDGLPSSLSPEINTYSGWVAGVTADIPIMHKFSFAPEANFVQKGFIADATFLEKFVSLKEIEDFPLKAKFKVRTNSIEVPLILKYVMKRGPVSTYIFGGPTVSFQASGEVRPVVNLLFDFNLPILPYPKSLSNGWEVGGQLGIGIQGQIGTRNKLFTDARLYHGFTNVLGDPLLDIDINNRGFQLAVGFGHSF
jgi:hypothetical protein